MKHDEAIIQEHFSDYLQKPITRNEMIDCLMKHLPHQVKELDSSLVEQMPGLDNDMQMSEALKRIGENELMRKELADGLFNSVLPLIEALKTIMDTDQLDKLVQSLNELIHKHDIKIFNHHIEKLQLASEIYDFESFSAEIQRLESTIHKITNH
jgi:hypothetical protein